MSDPSTVVTTAAYLLFYRRRSSGHLGGPRFAEILDKFNSSGDEGEAAESGEDAEDQDRQQPALSLDGDELPPYDGDTSGDTIQDSIENDSGSSIPGVKSMDMTQAWSFNALDDKTRDGSVGLGYASDDAEINSSDDERGRGFLDQDTDMAPVEALYGPQEQRGVISVHAGARSDAGSDEVTEIHLEGDKPTRQE